MEADFTIEDLSKLAVTWNKVVLSILQVVLLTQEYHSAETYYGQSLSILEIGERKRFVFLEFSLSKVWRTTKRTCHFLSYCFQTSLSDLKSLSWPGFSLPLQLTASTLVYWSSNNRTLKAATVFVVLFLLHRATCPLLHPGLSHSFL